LREPTVRQVLAENATSFQLPEGEMEANPEEALRQFREQFTGISLPIGWGITRGQGAAFLDDNCRLFPGREQTFGVPVIGTPFCFVPPQATSQNNFAVKLAGIFITTLAARQGAPFWFDILKRVVNVRGTGANPAEKGK
jgi:hypothetical protein